MKRRPYSFTGTCKQCAKFKSISARGLCQKCAAANSQVVVNQMISRQGPAYSNWQIGMLRNAAKISSDMQQARESKEKLNRIQMQMQEQQ